MGVIYNIFCDESCHMEHDGKRAMVLGAVSCPMRKVKLVNDMISSIKDNHNIAPNFEIKWTKVGAKKIEFYESLLGMFFNTEFLTFRAVVADKTVLDHGQYQQTHDEWYYKMYYILLKKIIETGNRYNIYLDIKDTNGKRKVEKLHEVLCSKFYDFECETIKRVSTIASHEASLLQLTDLLAGVLSSNANNATGTNEGKIRLRKYFMQATGYSLSQNTPYWLSKTNWLIWPNGAL